jgi:hypothetical protein
MAKVIPTFYSHDYQFEISSADELAGCFRERDRSRVILRNDFELPMRVQYYFTWSDPSGAYRYLLFKKPGWETPLGLVFRSGSSHVDGATGGICDWCHAYGSSNQIGLLTTAVNSKRTVGMMLCLDLSCGDKIENGLSQSSKAPEVRILEVCERMGRFFDETIRPLTRIRIQN